MESNSTKTRFTLYECNSEMDVIFLRETSGYSDAINTQINTVGDYMLKHYPGQPRIIYTAQQFDQEKTRLDPEFKKGLVFVCDKHEIKIYKKTATGGRVFGYTYEISCIGKIGVLEGQYETNEAELIALRNECKTSQFNQQRADMYSDEITHLKLALEKLTNDNKNLLARIDQLQEEVKEAQRSGGISNTCFRPPPKRPLTQQQTQQRANFNPVIGDLKALFAGGSPKRITGRHGKTSQKNICEIVEETISDI